MYKKTALLTLAATLLYAPLSQATVLSYHGFETGKVGTKGETKDFFREGPNNSSVTITNREAFKGLNSAQLSFNHADWSANPAQDGFRRAEITSKSPPWPQKMILKQDWYTGFAQKIDANWAYDYPQNREIVWQFHGDAIGGGSPPLSAVVVGDQLQIWTRTYTTPSQITADGTVKVLGSFPLDKGKWTRWVVMTNFDLIKGHFKIWRNGVLVIDYTGPNLYATAPDQVVNNQVAPAMINHGPYFKIGVYKWGWGDTPTKAINRTVYVDELRIGDKNSSYNEVRPDQ